MAGSLVLKRLLRLLQTLACAAFALSPAPVLADARGAAEAARSQVVRITATFGGDRGASKHGFGFVVGERGGFLYVATANHVVRDDADDSPARVTKVEFFTDRGVTAEATVLETHRRAPTDLAVIRVARPMSVTSPPSVLCDDGQALKRDTPVAYVGRDGDWYVPTSEGLVNSAAPDETFRADVDFSRGVAVKEGTSGAPLLSSRGLLGMIIQDSNSNVATVLAIEAVARAFQGWNHPWAIEACHDPYVLASGAPVGVAAPPLPSPTSPDTGRQRFELGFGVGYGLPFGNADGGDDGDLGHFTRGSLPIVLHAGFRPTSQMLAGAVIQYAKLLDNRTECPNCHGSTFRVGIVGRYRPALNARMKPWVGIGLGYDQMSSAGIVWRGFEIMRLELGADVAFSPSVSVGPFVSASVSYYDKTGPTGEGVPSDFPVWLSMGLRTAVAIP
ncbi:MAG: serine protease [Pseudomonadota bacterium]